MKSKFLKKNQQQEKLSPKIEKGDKQQPNNNLKKNLKHTIFII
jgi:hypothetical protein